MFCLRRVLAALRADLGVLAITIVILGIACGPTPNRKRRDASPITDTGGFGGLDETGGSVGTGGFATGGSGTDGPRTVSRGEGTLSGPDHPPPPDPGAGEPH